MKIVVIGGTGLIGKKLVSNLKEKGQEAIAASPSSGVNTLTGEGLEQVLSGADVLVDVSNSPSFEEKPVMEFFSTSTKNLLQYAKAAEVKHFVALSVIGTQKLSASAYFRAKIVQENLITASTLPYTIVQAAQFFEFVRSIADGSTVGNEVHLPPAYFQPILAADVSSALVPVALGKPVDGRVEIAGPEKFRMDELIRQILKEENDPRQVVTDPKALYFGAKLEDDTLVPSSGGILAKTRYEEFAHSSKTAA